MRSSKAWRCRSTSAAVRVLVDAHRGQQLARVGVERGELGVGEAGRRPRRGRARRPRTAAARRAGGGGAPARGRSAGRAPPRCPRRRAARRGGGRGGAGSASTGRGRARPWAGAAGSSRPPPTAGAAPESSSPSGQPRNTHSPGGAERLGRGPLLGLAGDDERGGVRGRIPAALRAVGADQVVDDRARGRPLGQRGAARRTRRRRGGRRWPAPPRASAGSATRHRQRQVGAAEPRSAGGARSAGTSTSQPSRGVGHEPQRRARGGAASARWAAKLPAP